jgi:type IV secretory pathway ATPase VirB11/archaellum biosynthesis ATPase
MSNHDHDEKKPGADGRKPTLLPAQPGRVISLGGVIERIVKQFQEDYDSTSPALQEADTEVKRRMLVRDVALYVFSVEALHLSHAQQSDIIRRVYSELFGYGPLDALFSDERITTIQLTGAEKVAVRYAPGTDLVPLEPIFDDAAHLRRMLQRLLQAARAEIRPELPAIETGLPLGPRPACVNVALFTTQLSADIRLHPAQPPALADLVQQGYVPAAAADFLQALAQSDHGFVIVGDTESGKTTLLSALAQFLPQPESVAAVERAGELRLPAAMRRYPVRWPVGAAPGSTFAEQVTAALAAAPALLLLDEVRSDEGAAIVPLLTADQAPRQIWVFRGTADAKRTRTALAMLARMAHPGQPEAAVAALYHRLPFVVTVKRRRGSLSLREIAEWQWPPGADYPDYVALWSDQGDGVVPTGRAPALPLTW